VAGTTGLGWVGIFAPIARRTYGIALSVLKSQVGTPVAYILSPDALQSVDIAVLRCDRNRADWGCGQDSGRSLKKARPVGAAKRVIAR